MLRARLTATGNGLKYGKLAFAVLIAMAFCLVHPASTAYASKKEKRNQRLRHDQDPDHTRRASAVDRWQAGRPDHHRLPGVSHSRPGLHTVVITLPSGERWSREINVAGGRRTCVDLNYRPPVVQPKSPCPYPVNCVGATDGHRRRRDNVYRGRFLQRHVGAQLHLDRQSRLTPRSSVAPAHRLSRLTLPVFGGKRITAVLVVDDGSGVAACRQTAQASTMVPPTEKHRENPSREFDVCCSCSFDDQKARLDNLGIELQNDPSTTSYIIAYAGRTSRTGQAERLLARAKDYLVGKRGVDPARLVTLNGGYREEDCVELVDSASGRYTATGHTDRSGRRGKTGSG